MKKQEINITKLEKAILKRVDHLDSSVQFKLDEIYQEVTKSSHELDQGPLVEAIDNHMTNMENTIADQLKEHIPDYGMAKSLISENLEEIKQIVSEVSISEVELLKTQLSVAEEAEQEALHAIVYLKDQLEDIKRDETFGKIMGGIVTDRYSKASTMSGGVRKMSLGAQSALSYEGIQQGSQSRGLSLGIPKGGNKTLSGIAKVDEWKRVFVDIEDKSTGLRNMYNQLREQREQIRLQQQLGTVPGNDSDDNIIPKSTMEESKEDLMGEGLMGVSEPAWGQLVYGQQEEEEKNNTEDDDISSDDASDASDGSYE